jgi:hypothetical protein
MGHIGIPELFVLLVVLIIYGVPIAVAAWIIRTLRLVQSDVKTMQGELAEIRLLLLNKN